VKYSEEEEEEEEEQSSEDGSVPVFSIALYNLPHNGCK
jgi:hypothetical protein